MFQIITALIIGILVGFSLLVAWVSRPVVLALPSPVTAVGIISDSWCQHDHSRRLILNTRECTLSCVQHGATFVLVTGSHVYRIQNQRQLDLGAFAALRVTVEGTVIGEGILVNRIAAASTGTIPRPSHGEPYLIVIRSGIAWRWLWATAR
jgi:hypothetical protein